MYAIISELDPESSVTVSDLWQKLREACGLQAIYNIPTPHFTWFVADHLNFDEAAPILSQIAENTASLTLHTFGLGIFSGKHPVLYLPLVKSKEMIALHHQIWDHVQPFGEDVQLYYSPRLWVPHITLALQDLNRDNLACAVNRIAFDPIELFVSVNNLAIAEHEDQSLGQILHQFFFDGAKHI